MLVKTIRPHSNGYGKTFHKKKGDSYDHPNPADLLAEDIVEEVSKDENDSKDGGVSGSGESSLSTEKLDSEKRDGASNDKKSRAGKTNG